MRGVNWLISSLILARLSTHSSRLRMGIYNNTWEEEKKRIKKVSIFRRIKDFRDLYTNGSGFKQRKSGAVSILDTERDVTEGDTTSPVWVHVGINFILQQTEPQCAVPFEAI